MEGFTEIIERATATVGQEYFLLKVHGADPVYRERVYCYELYHQMRSIWPADCPYLVNGEVDKQRHPYFEDGEYPKPDFLVHIPGSGGNYAVLEVKARAPAAADIRKDMSTLARFRDLGYQRALYIIYGSDPAEARDRLSAAIDDVEILDKFELWVHQAAGEPAEHVGFT